MEDFIKEKTKMLDDKYCSLFTTYKGLRQDIIQLIKDSNQLEPSTKNNCKHFYVSEFDYYIGGAKKYYHIKIINETEKFIEFEWVGSGTKQLMPLKTFNEVFTIEEKLNDKH